VYFFFFLLLDHQVRWSTRVAGTSYYYGCRSGYTGTQKRNSQPSYSSGSSTVQNRRVSLFTFSLTDSLFLWPLKTPRCTRKASSALQQKRKSAALTYIRSRKQLEDLLSKRLGSSSTLESTLISVEAAVGDIEVLGFLFLLTQLVVLMNS